MGACLQAGRKNQLVEVRIVAQRSQILIVLGSNPQGWLQIQGALERLEGEIDRTKTGTSGGQTIVYMSCLRFTLESALKHLLGSDIFTTVQFDDAAIIKRIGISREHALGAQPR